MESSCRAAAAAPTPPPPPRRIEGREVVEVRRLCLPTYPHPPPRSSPFITMPKTPKTVLDKVLFAIRELKDFKGSSRQAIAKFLKQEFSTDNATALKAALKKGVASGALTQQGQSFKIAGEEYEEPEGERLQVSDVKVGDGNEAAAGDEVTVAYEGTLQATGEPFDKASKFTFLLGAGEVIKGWDQVSSLARSLTHSLTHSHRALTHFFSFVCLTGAGRGGHAGRREAKTGGPSEARLRREGRVPGDSAQRHASLHRETQGHRLSPGRGSLPVQFHFRLYASVSTTVR